MSFFVLGLFAGTAQAGWEPGLILTPIIAGTQYQAGDESYLSSRLGGVLGLSYRQDGVTGLHGRTKVVYQENFGSELDFREIKLGSYFGPRLGPLDLEVGVDYMMSRNTVPALFSGEYTALATPIRLNFDVNVVHMEVAAGPIFLMDTISGDTRKGSDTLIGIGDEFFYMAAASIELKPLAEVGLSASRHHSAYGVDTVIGANLSILFLGFGSSSHAY